MPEVIVYALTGSTAEQKKKLMQSITESVVDSIGVRPEHVTVQIIESPPDSKAKGGVPFSER
jgi:4-oxalocrotonate tautomerase